MGQTIVQFPWFAQHRTVSEQTRGYADLNWLLRYVAEARWGCSPGRGVLRCGGDVGGGQFR